jgi:hypothetical protein
VITTKSRSRIRKHRGAADQRFRQLQLNSHFSYRFLFFDQDAGEPSPHGELGIASGPPAPAPELPLLDHELPPPEAPPPEPPLDAELLVPVLVVVLDVAPVSLQYVGSWVQV